MGNNFTDKLELGPLDNNRGNRSICMQVPTDSLQYSLLDYDLLHVMDKNNNIVFATANLNTPYPFVDTSPELFADWLRLFFIWDPLTLVLILIFPLTLDYFILISKIIVTFVFRLRPKPFYDSLYNPKITIMIPAHNEEKGIENAINSILGAEYNNKEIIVIDDGSKDNTYQIAKKYSDQNLIKLIHRDQA